MTAEIAAINPPSQEAPAKPASPGLWTRAKRWSLPALATVSGLLAVACGTNTPQSQITEQPVPTPLAACNPEQFKKDNGFLPPPAIGGEATNPDYARINTIVEQYLNQCKMPDQADVDFWKDLPVKYKIITPVPYVDASPTPTVVAKPEVKLTKEEAVVKVDGIINLIKNPDPELLKKYNVTPKQLADEQAILLYGGTGKGSSDLPKTADGHQYIPDSLTGIRAAIDKGDMATAKDNAKKLYSQVSNSSFNDTTQLLMSNEEALKIDPQKKFLMFASDIPNARPEMKDKAVYIGSEIKEPAAFELIKLWYSL